MLQKSYMAHRQRHDARYLHGQFMHREKSFCCVEFGVAVLANGGGKQLVRRASNPGCGVRCVRDPRLSGRVIQRGLRVAACCNRGLGSGRVATHESPSMHNTTSWQQQAAVGPARAACTLAGSTYHAMNLVYRPSLSTSTAKRSASTQRRHLLMLCAGHYYRRLHNMYQP